MTSRLLWACIVLASTALLLGFTLDGPWLWLPAVLSLAGFWLLGEWRRWSWAASVSLVLCTALAAVGMALDLRAGWMLVSLVAALIAWDLSLFLAMLQSIPQVDGANKLEQDHLRRLGLAAGLGLLFGALALSVHARLSFWAMVLLGLVGILSFSRVVAFFRVESE